MTLIINSNSIQRKNNNTGTISLLCSFDNASVSPNRKRYIIDLGNGVRIEIYRGKDNKVFFAKNYVDWDGITATAEHYKLSKID